MSSPVHDDPSDTTTGPRSRQKPGNACDACRRRKLRCDRKQPLCGACVESGATCSVAASGPRGPKRGHMKALLARISAMEQRLAEKPPDSSSGDPSLDAVSAGSFLDWPYTDLDDFMPTAADNGGLALVLDGPQAVAKDVEFAANLSSETRTDAVTSHQEAPRSVPTAVMSEASFTAAVTSLPDLLHSDRDQLYFDRIHAFYPILNENRYYSWSYSGSKTIAQHCLQQTMWALATSASTQPQSIGDLLYHDASRSMEELEAKENACQLVCITQVQAWLLLAFYEFMRVDFRRGWMSAGRAFRLIQLMRLHELDLADISLPLSPADWVDKEERRRTFWLAYCLDRFISLSNGCPLTLGEQVAVRMPAPNINFQTGQPFLTNLLSDAMLTQDAGTQDEFAEFVVMATICGRALAHRQQSMAWMINSDPTQMSWDRHRQINADLTPRIVALSLRHPPVTAHTHPLVLFTHAMAQAMVLYMYRLMTEVLPVSDENDQSLLDESATSFNVALGEVLNLTQTLSRMSCFKVHPLCPIPLYICVDNLTAFNKGGRVFDEQLKVICNALNSLKRINILGQQSRLGEARDSRAEDTEDLSLQPSETMELLQNL
ncbi:MAG: hypothetical protein Q9169_005390 [Polycauliona sp. 2 TL-2023]